MYRQEDKIQGSNILMGASFIRTTGDTQLRVSSVSAQNTWGALGIIYDSGVYSGMALMSMDGLLRPVSMSGADGLPRYGKFTFDTVLMKSGPVAPVPPLLRGTGGTTSNLQYNVQISRDYLNPFTNPTGRGLSFSMRHEASGTGGKGHDIDLVGHTGLPSGYTMSTSYGDGSGNESYSNDIKFMALRGPLIVQGWGYDTNSKPIPNAADTYNNTIQGIFTTSNLKDTFMPNFLQKSATWPVGPIDLRWDRKRGVWTSPQPYRFMHVRLLDTIHSLQGFNPTTTNISGARAKVPYTIDTFYDSSGNIMSAGTPSVRPEITVYDRTNTIHPSGSDVLCYYDTVEEKYYILNGYNDAIKYSITNQTGWKDKTVDASYSITGNINIGNSTTPTGIIDFTSDNGTSDYDVPIFGGDGIPTSEGLAIKRTIGGTTKYEVIKQYNKPSNTVFFSNAKYIGSELGQAAYACDIEAIDGSVTTSGVVLASAGYGSLSGFNGTAHLYPIGFVSNNQYSGYYRYKYEPITLTLLGKQSCSGGARISVGAETYQTTALVSKNGISLYRDSNTTTGNIGLSIDVKNYNDLFNLNIYDLISDSIQTGTGLSTPKSLTNGVVGWDSIVFSKGLKSTYNATSPIGIPNEPGCALGIRLDINTNVAPYPTGSMSSSFGENFTNIYFDDRAFKIKRDGATSYYQFDKGNTTNSYDYIESISVGTSGVYVTGVSYVTRTMNINTGIGTVVSII